MLLSCSRLKGTSVLPSSQAILVTVQVVNCSSRHWNAEVLKYVWSILMTNLGLSWRDAMPLVGSSMPPEGGAGPRNSHEVWRSELGRHPNLQKLVVIPCSQGYVWSLEEKKRALKEFLGMATTSKGEWYTHEPNMNMYNIYKYYTHVSIHLCTGHILFFKYSHSLCEGFVSCQVGHVDLEFFPGSSGGIDSANLGHTIVKKKPPEIVKQHPASTPRLLTHVGYQRHLEDE